jgi:3-methyladenine DNA glycosylase Tag
VENEMIAKNAQGTNQPDHPPQMVYVALPPHPTDADYFDLLTRKMFHAGFQREVVDRRWAGFVRAFADFDPARVAMFAETELEQLFVNPDIIRNRAKIRAVIANARHFVEVARSHGSWMAWLTSLDELPYEQLADTLGACLSHCGPSTVFYFLFEAGHATLDDRPELRG